MVYQLHRNKRFYHVGHTSSHRSLKLSNIGQNLNLDGWPIIWNLCCSRKEGDNYIVWILNYGMQLYQYYSFPGSSFESAIHYNNLIWNTYLISKSQGDVIMSKLSQEGQPIKWLCVQLFKKCLFPLQNSLGSDPRKLLLLTYIQLRDK